MRGKALCWLRNFGVARVEDSADARNHRQVVRHLFTGRLGVRLPKRKSRHDSTNPECPEGADGRLCRSRPWRALAKEVMTVKECNKEGNSGAGHAHQS